MESKVGEENKEVRSQLIVKRKGKENRRWGNRTGNEGKDKRHKTPV